MKILVPIKRVPDPALKTVINDGKLDLSNVSWVLNPFDEYAVETALRLLENADEGDKEGEIIVVTIGPADAAAELRKGLAMGADRAIRVDAEDATIDSRTVADALGAIYEAEKPDLIVMGKQAVDGDANQVGQMLAAKLNLPQATFAATVELSEDKKTLTVGREVDAGVEYKKFALPGVLTVDLRIVAPKSVINHVTPADYEYADGARYPSLKGITRAKKKPMDEKTLSDLGVEANPTVTETSVELPPERQAGQILESVAELVDKLKNEAKAL